MTIESDLKSINSHLSRIAAAMEGLLAEHGHVPESATTVKSPAKKKTSKKKAKARVQTLKETIVGKPSEASESEFSFDDVRGALKTLKAEVSQAAVKSLLKKYGASTIGQVDEKHYSQLIAEAEAQAE